MNINRTLKLASVLLIVMMLTVAVYAFAAANTFAAGNNAGDGSQQISGYAISNVHYVLGANPADIDSMTFTTVPPIPTGGSAHVKLVSGATTYTSCTFAGATVTCAFSTPVSAAAANEFRVIIAQ